MSMYACERISCLSDAAHHDGLMLFSLKKEMYAMYTSYPWYEVNVVLCAVNGTVLESGLTFELSSN